MLEDYKCGAYKYHDKLVEMGGRPTRQVLEHPAGTAIYGKDEIRIIGENGELKITVAPNEDLTVHHWKTECTLFEEELERWELFRKSQETAIQVPLLKIQFDSNSLDQRLIDVLIRLNDWRDYQHYQRKKVGHDLMHIRCSTQQMKEIMYEESASREPTSSVEIQRALAYYFWDKDVLSKQMNLEASQAHLAWIESQILEILAEACASLAANIPLLQELDMKLEEQANSFDQELKTLKAKPACPVQYPHQSAKLTQRLCHWGSEITRLIYEYWEWKVFLRWRKTPQCNGKVANTRELASGEQVSDLQLWRDYVSCRRDQLDRSRIWVAGWQEEILFRENKIKTTPREHVYMLESSISDLRTSVVEFQKDVQIAELRFRSAEQQLAEISTQHGGGEGSGLLHTPRTDVENLVSPCSASTSKVHSKGRSTRVKGKSTLPTHQASTSKKTRSARTLDQPFSGRVRKHTGKKPTRNAKASTGKETTGIMSATSLENRPTNSPPPRRSQRLEEKAATSLSAAPP